MARIRTIKPEFWRNRQLASLSDFTRLVAIALLNVADDEGYFEADPLLIRGDVFPFHEDSMSIHGALMELSNINYCKIQDHPQKGPIGRVVNFEKHQVISRPSKSKLRVFYEETSVLHEDSMSIHGGLNEDSALEQGTGNRERNREWEGESGKSTHTPRSRKKFETEEFEPEWTRWCEFRFAIDGREIPEPQVETLLMDLGRRGSEKAKRDIEFSIRKSAKSILDSDNDFESRARNGPSANGYRGKKSMTTAELLEKEKRERDERK